MAQVDQEFVTGSISGKAFISEGFLTITLEGFLAYSFVNVWSGDATLWSHNFDK